jgi:starch phosphorylase
VKLINFIRECVRKHWVRDRISSSIALAEFVMHDPSILTLGFARRLATYKRANLLLHDRSRLKKS